MSRIQRGWCVVKKLSLVLILLSGIFLSSCLLGEKDLFYKVTHKPNVKKTVEAVYLNNDLDCIKSSRTTYFDWRYKKEKIKHTKVDRHYCTPQIITSIVKSKLKSCRSNERTLRRIDTIRREKYKPGHVRITGKFLLERLIMQKDCLCYRHILTRPMNQEEKAYHASLEECAVFFTPEELDVVSQTISEYENGEYNGLFEISEP
jgi:hypothetical protein